MPPRRHMRVRMACGHAGTCECAWTHAATQAHASAHGMRLRSQARRLPCMNTGRAGDQVGSQSGKQSVRQAGRPRCRQAYRHACRQAGARASRPAGALHANIRARSHALMKARGRPCMQACRRAGHVGRQAGHAGRQAGRACKQVCRHVSAATKAGPMILRERSAREARAHRVQREHDKHRYAVGARPARRMLQPHIHGQRPHASRGHAAWTRRSACLGCTAQSHRRMSIAAAAAAATAVPRQAHPPAHTPRATATSHARSRTTGAVETLGQASCGLALLELSACARLQSLVAQSATNLPQPIPTIGRGVLRAPPVVPVKGVAGLQTSPAAASATAGEASAAAAAGARGAPAAAAVLCRVPGAASTLRRVIVEMYVLLPDAAPSTNARTGAALFPGEANVYGLFNSHADSNGRSLGRLSDLKARRRQTGSRGAPKAEAPSAAPRADVSNGTALQLTPERQGPRARCELWRAQAAARRQLSG
eukprot:363729-Chlamydomonas_euryale.AAC.2